MYRIIRPQGIDALEKNLNQMVIDNPDYNCKIIQYADNRDGWMRVAFYLTKIPPEEQLNKIGEYKVVKSWPNISNDPGIPEFENALNAVIQEEGWRLDHISSSILLAILYRDVRSKLQHFGFGSIEELRAFEQSGSPTKAIFLEHQRNIANYLKKIEEIHQDAEQEFQQKRFGDYIRLAYLEVEKILDALYCVHNHSKDTQGNKFSDILVNLGNDFGIRLVDVEQFIAWRDVRNNFVHENQKVSPQSAQKAKTFFDETIAQLKKLLRHLPYTGKPKIGLEGFKERKKGDTEEEHEMDEEDENSNEDMGDDDY